MPSSGKVKLSQANEAVEVVEFGTTARCQHDVSSFEPAGFSGLLHPSIKGSRQCFCHGAVVKMVGNYGWLLAYGKVHHPLAEQRGGLIYVHRDDIVPGRVLRAGDAVSFYLYVDGQGLGAEGVDIGHFVNANLATEATQQHYFGASAVKPTKGDSHQVQELLDYFGASAVKPTKGDSHQVQCHVQPSPTSGTLYYLPVIIANAPYACTSKTWSSSFENVVSPDSDPAVVLNTGDSLDADRAASDAPKDIDAPVTFGGKPFVPGSELPSVGSAGHSDGSCKRCAFFPKGRCLNGVDCTHCHFDHIPRQRLRKKFQKGRKQERQTQSMDPSDDLEEGAADLPFDELCEFTTTDEVLMASDAQRDNYTSETSLIPNTVVPPGSCQESVCDDESHCIMSSIDFAKGCCETLYDVFVPDMHSETRAPSASLCSDDDDMSTSTCGNDKESIGDGSCHLSDQKSAVPFDDEDLAFREPVLTQKPSGGITHDENDRPAADACCRRQRLASSPLSWAAQQRSRKTGHMIADSEVPPLEVARMARALLNKLTKERFESLSKQILALPLSTNPQLAAVAAEIFETATTQDGFRSLYVDMCKRLDIHLAEMAGDVGGKSFRKALVNECQKTFEQSLQPQDLTMFEGMASDERFELESKIKSRRLGNIRFIGELLVCRLLAHKLMIPIIHELLNGDEMALELLIALLRIVGPAFDQKSSQYRGVLQDAFATLQHKKSGKSVSSRLRFQLIDLFDARASRWVPHAA
jgi:hypothetical protein